MAIVVAAAVVIVIAVLLVIVVRYFKARAAYTNFGEDGQGEHTKSKYSQPPPPPP